MQQDYIQEQQNLLPQIFSINDKEMIELANKYFQRENGDEDIEYYLNKGGDKWLQQGLQTNFENGIDESIIDQRTKLFGDNKKKKIKTKTFWQLSWEAFDDLILKILMVAGIASIIINVIMEEDERSTAWIEGFAIIIAVLIVVFVTAYNDLKKEKEFQKLSEEAENGKKIVLIRNGIVNNEAKIQDVLVGDLIGLQGGMEIPGDAIVVSANQLELDESAMTGETLAMKKNTANFIVNQRKQKQKLNQKLKHNSLASNILLAGTTVQCGTGKAIIINVGKNSAIGRIQEKLIAGEEESTPLQLKLEKIARDIGYFGLAAAILIFLVLIIRLIIEESIDGWNDSAVDYLGDILEYFLISIAILVVAIPEGLPLAVTLSLAFSVDKMAKQKNLVRRMQACETMGGANIICSDKTGTLTRNEMYWTDFYNNKNIKIFNSQTNEALSYKQIANEQTQQIFLNTVILNSDEDPKSKSGNPTEMALLKYIDQNDINVVQYRQKNNKPLFQAPFTSSRKRMSKILQQQNIQYIYMKGASEYMLQCSDKILNLQTGEEESLTENKKKEINDAITSMAKQALRTIGLCYKKVNVNQLNLTENGKDEHGIFDYEKQGFTFLGIAGIKDIIRPEVPKSLRQCEIAGIDVKMVTGDNKITARAIAEEIGLITERNKNTALVFEGPEFYRLIGGVICKNCNSDNDCKCVNNEYELQEVQNKGKKIRIDTIKNGQEFDKIWKNLKVLARSRPEDKYALVVGLKERDNVVAVTGDGTNDAPALKKADVGFAMAIAGTEVAKQAADIQILDDNFASIIVAVKWGRNIYDSIRKFLQFQLTVNVVAVITTFVAAAILQEAIFSPVQMLWINLIMDTLAALALATEPPSDQLLYRKPYARTEYIISPLMMKHILGQAIFQSTVIFIIVFAGEFFLFDIIAGRQLKDEDGKLIVCGRTSCGYDREDHDGQYSIHYTYNFNIFVMMNFFNFFNCRVLDDSFNVFRGICKSRLLIIIMIIIFILQIIFLTFLGKAIRVVQWGLDPISWLFSIAIGSLSLLVSVILKLIPFQKCLPATGNKEITEKELDQVNPLQFLQKIKWGIKGFFNC